LVFSGVGEEGRLLLFSKAFWGVHSVLEASAVPHHDQQLGDEAHLGLILWIAKVSSSLNIMLQLPWPVPQSSPSLHALVSLVVGVEASHLLELAVIFSAYPPRLCWSQKIQFEYVSKTILILKN
jgi:hypothetical protein